MEYATESLTDVLTDEMDALITAYYVATKAHQGIPPYDFIWGMYHAIEAIDHLVVTTARDDGKLAGFALYICMDAPHHSTLKVAECDTLSVAHTHRGQGIGKSLYKYTEGVLKERGVQRVTNRYRVLYDEKPIFPGLGFRLDEHVYVKEI